MNKKNYFFLLSLLFSSLLVLNSCFKEEDNEPLIVEPDNRVFIINEGPFQEGNGSLSIYYRNTEDVYNNIFEEINGFPLGNIAQSLSVHNNKVYIVVNNAGRVEIASMDNLVSLGAIEGINLPRFFLGIDNSKAYVSSWDNQVYVVDLNTNEVTGNIPTATGPERMMQVGEEIWVLNQGGFSYDSTITIINGQTDEVIKNLVVGHKPSGIVSDKDGNVWVMCSGNGWNGFPGADDTKGRLLCINPENHEIIKTLDFPDIENHPQKLVVNKQGETVYFLYPGGLYAQDLSEQSLELKVVLDSETMFYGIGCDHATGNIFVTDPLDYMQNGLVHIIDPVKEEILQSFDAGVIPGEMYFN